MIDMIINYFNVIDRFHSKVEDYNLIDLIPSDVYAMEKEWLISTLSLPEVFRLF